MIKQASKETEINCFIKAKVSGISCFIFTIPVSRQFTTIFFFFVKFVQQYLRGFQSKPT